MPAESLNDVILDPRHEDAFLGHSDRAANPGEKIQARSLIVAVGARHKHLGVPGEHELENRGVTFCATCDGALPAFRNKPFVVVGGGDTACQKAMYLTRFGSIVHLVHRRDTLRASKIMAERTLANRKIQPECNSTCRRSARCLRRSSNRRAPQACGDGRIPHAGVCGRFRRHWPSPEYRSFSRAARHGRHRLFAPSRRELHECSRRLCGRGLRRFRLSTSRHRRGHGLHGRH